MLVDVVYLDVTRRIGTQIGRCVSFGSGISAGSWRSNAILAIVILFLGFDCELQFGNLFGQRFIRTGDQFVRIVRCNARAGCR